MSLHQNIAPAPQAKSEFVVLKSGQKLHFKSYGGPGVPLVFLHGLADSSRSFEAVIRNLRHPFRIYAVDFRGHGNSDPADSYAIADFTGDVVEFIESQVGGHVHLAGHSMGSIVAQRVAAARPDLVTRLVLVGAAVTAAGHKDLAGLRDEIAAFGAQIPADYIDGFQRSTVTGHVSESDLQDYVKDSLKLSAATWIGAIDGLLREPTGELREVSVPALVIWGLKDAIFGRAAQETLSRFLVDRRTVTYSDAGHAPHWEHPSRVASDIERFLLLPWEG